MKIGVSGHQQRAGIDWEWVKSAIDRILAAEGAKHIGYSSLAVGSDQLFARAILDQRNFLVAVVPSHDYERCFDPRELVAYRELLSQATVIELTAAQSSEEAFYAAGRYIVDHVDLLVAIWDGRSSEGLGGTADIVGYAKRIHKPIAHIDPLKLHIGRL